VWFSTAQCSGVGLARRTTLVWVAFDHGTERPFSGRTVDGTSWENQLTGLSPPIATLHKLHMHGAPRVSSGVMRTALDYRRESLSCWHGLFVGTCCFASGALCETVCFYVGAISGLPLFSSDAKFDSGAPIGFGLITADACGRCNERLGGVAGSGWPSFSSVLDVDHIVETRDDSQSVQCTVG
jgi:peptide methionine sulfoxide reductase MsrB